MECPKCKRSFSAKKTACIYCGASLDGAYSSSKARMAINDKTAIICSEEPTKVELTELEEIGRQKIKDAIRNGENEIKGSELYEYLDQDIHEDLLAFVLSLDSDSKTI